MGASLLEHPRERALVLDRHVDCAVSAVVAIVDAPTVSSCCAASKTKSAWRSVSRASRTTSAWSFCSCEGQRGDKSKAHDLLALLAVGEQADGADEQAVEVLLPLQSLGEVNSSQISGAISRSQRAGSLHRRRSFAA